MKLFGLVIVFFLSQGIISLLLKWLHPLLIDLFVQVEIAKRKSNQYMYGLFCSSYFKLKLEKHVWPWWSDKPVCVATWELAIREKEYMQMNTIKILLNFGQNNKQVNTLPPC